MRVFAVRLDEKKVEEFRQIARRQSLAWEVDIAWSEVLRRVMTKFVREEQEKEKAEGGLGETTHGQVR